MVATVLVIFSNVSAKFWKIHVFGDRNLYATTVTPWNRDIATDTRATDTDISNHDNGRTLKGVEDHNACEGHRSSNTCLCLPVLNVPQTK